jgi:hypothetical protein
MGYALPTFPTSFTGTGGGGSGACTVNNYISCAGDGGTGGTGDTKDPSGIVAIDGVLDYNFDLTSATHVSTGVYRVITVPSFEVLAGKTQCAIKVSPQGLLQVLPEALFSDFKGLSTILFSPTDVHIAYNPTLNELYVNDTDHSLIASVAYDRLAIFNPSTRSWNYINFVGEALPVIQTGKGTPLLFDTISQSAYTLCTGPGIGTLIFDMIGRSKVFDTWNNITHGQSFNNYILAINPANSTCIIVRDSHVLAWWTTVGGIPNSVVATAAFPGGAGYDTPGMTPVVDINNNYWIYKNLGGANQSWVRTFLGAGPTLSFEDISITTDLFSHPLTRINPNTNCFYYLSSNHDYLMKFDCTAKTATRVNASAYPALTAPNKYLTLRSITSLTWSSDYTKLIALRGGSDPADLLIVSPIDGLVDAGYTDTANYSRNFGSGVAVGAISKLWNVSSERIVQADFSGGEDFGLVSTTAVSYEAHWLSANECQIEFKDPYTGARVDSAFHIAFASEGTAAGGGGGTGTGEDLHQFVVPFAFGDSTPSLIGQIAANKNILSVQVFVSAAFNGVGATLSVGPTALPTDLMTTLENNPALVGEYSVYTVKSYGTATNLYLHIVPGAGASTGTGVVVIEYQP